MAVTHAVCWVPYFTVMLIYSIAPLVPIADTNSVDNAAELFAIIRFLTSLINPLLYIFFKRDFRNALRILCGAKGIRIPNISLTTKTRSLTLRESSSAALHSIFGLESVMLSSFSKINEGFTDILEPEKTWGKSLKLRRNAIFRQYSQQFISQEERTYNIGTLCSFTIINRDAEIIHISVLR